MKLPIYAYGQPVLREKTRELSPDEPDLQKTIDNMFETMYGAKGVGLAAPQVGLSIRLFIVDGSPMDGALEDEPSSLEGFKRVMINPVMIEETGEEWAFEEGCLSIPELRANVSRNEQIRIKYLDREFNEQEEVLNGLKARIVQHEYDHLEGILFVDYLSSFQKQLLKGKLNKIQKGKLVGEYPMKHVKKR